MDRYCESLFLCQLAGARRRPASWQRKRDSQYLSIHPSISLSLYLSICLSLSIYLSLSLSIHPSIYLSLSLSNSGCPLGEVPVWPAPKNTQYLSIHPSIYLSLSLYIYIYTHICVYLSISLSLYTYIYIYIYIHTYTHTHWQREHRLDSSPLAPKDDRPGALRWTDGPSYINFYFYFYYYYYYY